MPRDLFANATAGVSAPRAPRDLFADAPLQAQPPAGLTPGSRGYADWAANAARAGERLPQVSPEPPPSAASLPSYDPRAAIVDAVMRGNPGTAGIWEIGKLVTNPDVRAAFGRDMDRLGNSLADAISLPIDAATNKGGINDVTFDPLTGKVQPFSDRLLERSANAAGWMSGADGMPNPSALVDTATGKVIRAPIRRALAADGVPPEQVGPRVAAMGDQAVAADLGPNMRALASAAAELPGEPAARMVATMAQRRAGGAERVAGAVNDTLGEATAPSAVQSEISGAKKAIGPDYEAALSNAEPVDTASLADGLDRQIGALRGKAKTSLQSVREMLDKVVTPEDMAAAKDELTQQWEADGREGPRPVYAPPLESDPRVLFQVRQAVDGMLDGETDGNARRALSAARQQIDALLAKAAPGLKAADARYADLAKQGEAVDIGQAAFDRNRSSIRPDELSAMLANSSSGVAARLSQGARAEIDRIIGTSGSDRAAMARLLAGDGTWNRQRLASLFGQDRANQLLRVLENEGALSETESAVLSAAGRRSGHVAHDALAPPDGGPGVVESALNFQPGSAAAKVAGRAFGWIDQMGRQHARDDIVNAIMGRGAWAAPIVRGVGPTPMPLPPAGQPMATDAPSGGDIVRIILRQ